MRGAHNHGDRILGDDVDFAESLRETHGSAWCRAKPGQPGALAVRRPGLNVTHQPRRDDF